MTSEALKQLATDHARLAPDLADFDLPPLTPAALSHSPMDCPDAEAVEMEIAKLGGEGWLRRESWAGRAAGDPGRAVAGVALEGEWALAESASAALLHDGRAWRLITLTEGVGGEAMLRETTELVERGDGSGRLRYAVYWGGAPAIRRVAARFLGFGKA